MMRDQEVDHQMRVLPNAVWEKHASAAQDCIDAARTDTPELAVLHLFRAQCHLGRAMRALSSADTAAMPAQGLGPRELRQAALKRGAHTEERIGRLISAIGRLIRESSEEESGDS